VITGIPEFRAWYKRNYMGTINDILSRDYPEWKPKKLNTKKKPKKYWDTKKSYTNKHGAEYCHLVKNPRY